MTRRRFSFAALTCALAGACTTDSPLQGCTRELRVQFSPRDTSIVAGQAFTASVQLSSCGGAEALSDTFGWQAENPAVATVDSLSGQVVGRSPGATRVAANGEHYGPVGSLVVTVHPDTLSL